MDMIAIIVLATSPMVALDVFIRNKLKDNLILDTPIGRDALEFLRQSKESKKRWNSLQLTKLHTQKPPQPQVKQPPPSSTISLTFKHHKLP